MLVQFSADTAEELKTKIVDFTKVFGITEGTGGGLIPPPVPAAIETHSQQAMPADIPVAKAKKGRGRPKAAKNPAPATAPEPVTPEPLTAPEVPQTTPQTADSVPVIDPQKATKENALKMLQEVNNSKGLQAARDCLSRFGADKLSNLLEKHYGDFINLCNEVLGGAAI